MPGPSSDARHQLSHIQRFSYGVGHVLNDLCASVWFSYLLIYFHDVIQFDNVLAGYTMLAGQIADAIATPFIGYEVDQTNGCCKYGKRKSWHIVGTVCVVASFPFILSRCIGCVHTACWAQFIYYLPFVVIFQFGWAATQISHLSLIPHLSPYQNERVGLNALRYTFTVLSNILVYGVTWLLLGVDSRGTQRELTSADAPRFQILVLVLLVVGVVFSVIFHIGTREEVSYNTSSLTVVVNGVKPDGGNVPKSDTLQWSCWLKEVQFYQVALLYMSSRLVVNLSQVYLPMYLTSSLKLDKSYIAIIPLVVYVSGFLSSLVMKSLNICAGRKVTYVLGALTVIGYSVWTWFLSAASLWQVFAMAVLLGIGTSTILVTALSMTADLIGENVSSGAFVYGALSFTDKLSNGLAVLIIQHLHPCRSVVCCSDCIWFYRNIMTFVPAGFAVLAILTLLTLAPQRIGRLRKRKVSVPVNDERSPLLPPVSDNEIMDR